MPAVTDAPEGLGFGNRTVAVHLLRGVLGFAALASPRARLLRRQAVERATGGFYRSVPTRVVLHKALFPAPNAGLGCAVLKELKMQFSRARLLLHDGNWN